jgi:hypothetical protein
MTTPFTAMRSQGVTFAKAYRAEELREATGPRRTGRVRSRRRRAVRWFRLPSAFTTIRTRHP